VSRREFRQRCELNTENELNHRWVCEFFSSGHELDYGDRW